MDGFSKAYNSVVRFIDEFANSSVGEYAYSKPVAHETLSKNNREPFYAEYNDNYLDGIIDNAVTRQVLRGIVDKRCSSQLKRVIQRSSELYKDSFPQLFSVYNHCCDILGIYNRPKTYITGCMAGINALSMEVCGKSYILISRDAVFYLDNKEQSFLLGHELGHYQQGNLVCHTLNGLLTGFTKSQELFGAMLADVIDVPLKRWCRQSELNADRAGYLCCDDLAAVESLFSRLGMIHNPDVFSLYKQLDEDHPLLSTRFQELQTFAYKQLT